MSNTRNLKIVLIGDSGVGKTTLNMNYIKGTKSLQSGHSIEDGPTIGASYYCKQINKGGEIIKLSIWDTAGQERYNSLASIYCRDASGCMCVFDVTNKTSFNHIDKWI